jgi:hypothetical protein
MEILKIVARPFPDSLLVQNFAVPAAFAAPMDFGQILEEESGAMEQRQQRSVMIDGKWVEAGFYVCEILPEKHSHVPVKAAAIRNSCIGMGALPSGPTVPSSSRFRKPAHGEAVPNIPGDAWQLACAIGDAYGYAEKRIAHGPFAAAKRTISPNFMP